jgi:hypothetical protein
MRINARSKYSVDLAFFMINNFKNTSLISIEEVETKESTSPIILTFNIQRHPPLLGVCKSDHQRNF